MVREHQEWIHPSQLGVFYVCSFSNGFKNVQTKAQDPESGVTVPLFHPRQQKWSEHFVWSDDGTQIVGISPCGRATVVALQLNNELAVDVRREWVAAGWHPPADEC